VDKCGATGLRSFISLGLSVSLTVGETFSFISLGLSEESFWIEVETGVTTGGFSLSLRRVFSVSLGEMGGELSSDLVFSGRDVVLGGF